MKKFNTLPPFRTTSLVEAIWPAALVVMVTDDGLVRVLDSGEVVAEVPAKALTDECPTYHLKAEEPNSPSRQMMSPAR